MRTRLVRQCLVQLFVRGVHREILKPCHVTQKDSIDYQNVYSTDTWKHIASAPRAAGSYSPLMPDCSLGRAPSQYPTPVLRCITIKSQDPCTRIGC